LCIAMAVLLPSCGSAGTPEDNWLVALSLTTSPHIGAVPGEGYGFAFGVREGGSERYSEGGGDLIAPPDPIVGINAYFHYPANPPYEQNLITSVVGPGPTITWLLIVKRAGGGGAAVVTLTWDDGDVGKVPDGYAVLELRDTEGSVLADMKGEASYAFTLQSAEAKRFHVVAERTP